MFIVYVQCHTCGRKEWATAAERDWVNAETGKPLGRKYSARHGKGKHRCPKCQEKFVREAEQVAFVAALGKKQEAEAGDPTTE